MNPGDASRIALRSIACGDAAQVLALNNDPEVMRFVGDRPFGSVEAARLWIERIREELPLGIGRWSIVTAEGDWLGRCSLRRQPDGVVLMGYRLFRTHWGKGYASEAVRIMLDMAFNAHGLDQVHSHVARENMPSRRVAERNGGVLCKEGPSGRHAYALVYRFTRRGLEPA